MLCWMLSNSHRFAPFFFSSAVGVNVFHPCLSALVCLSRTLHFLPLSLSPSCIASHTRSALSSCRVLSVAAPPPSVSPLPTSPQHPSQSSDHLKGKSNSLYPDYHIAPLSNWTGLPSQWNCIGIQYPAEWSSGGSWIARGSTKTVWVLYCAVKDTLLRFLTRPP